MKPWSVYGCTLMNRLPYFIIGPHDTTLELPYVYGITWTLDDEEYGTARRSTEPPEAPALPPRHIRDDLYEEYTEWTYRKENNATIDDEGFG